MASVTFPSSVGGNNSTYTDDNHAITGLAGYGYVTRLVPMFAQVVEVANYIVGRATAASASATQASTKAGEAATSAAAASTSASSAASSATTATTKAAEASASATIAAAPPATNLASGNSIDCSAGEVFYKTVTGNTTFSRTNVKPSGQVTNIILELTNGGNYTVTWWSGIKWQQGAAPILTSGGTDILGFYSYDGGTTWRGVLLSRDSK